MRHSIIARALPLLLALSLAAAVAAPGCNAPFTCPPGYTVYLCDFSLGKPNICGTVSTQMQKETCAKDRFTAAEQVDNYYPLTKLYNLVCNDTGLMSYPPIPNSISPKLMPQGLCDAVTADDSCLSCAKAGCCAQYEACVGDTNCTCLIGCLGTGNSATLCTMTDTCGTASAASLATAACLNAQCPQCGGMGGMCTPSSSSSSSGGPPACMPGSGLAGNSCNSDGDCESCSCNTQTMLCD